MMIKIKNEYLGDSSSVRIKEKQRRDEAKKIEIPDRKSELVKCEVRCLNRLCLLDA